METTLGKRIAMLRKQQNLKQENLAWKLGVSAQAVSKWENDISCPDISILPQLAKILGTTVDALLSGESEPAVIMVPEQQRKDLSQMLLRIKVDSADGDKVRVNLPVSLVQMTLEMGMNLPQIAGNDSLKNIDLNKIMELINCGVVGDLISVESSDGDVISICVE